MLEFIKQSIIHPRRTGAIVPSSKNLAQAMLQSVDFSQAKHIVELGPGTGVVTRLILQRMRKDARLTVIELNPVFCQNLKSINDYRMTIINGDVRYMSVGKADYVISSLPLNGFHKAERLQVIHSIKNMTKKYIQFHYSSYGEKYLKEHFSGVTKKWVVKNIPPAIVYTAVN